MVINFESGDQTTTERISRIITYIYQYYAEKITLEDLAAMEHLSEFYISHIIKDCTGMNFREFLCFARVEWSEIQLLDTNKKNAGIHLITVKIKGPADKQEIENARNELSEEYEIDLEKIKIVIT